MGQISAVPARQLPAEIIAHLIIRNPDAGFLNFFINRTRDAILLDFVQRPGSSFDDLQVFCFQPQADLLLLFSLQRRKPLIGLQKPAVYNFVIFPRHGITAF
ncbi:MAG TPA: hypothetical protein DD735_03925 [Clostridiales bacterium]|nr:hypothetical protein [Clostridiales bacterium]